LVFAVRVASVQLEIPEYEDKLERVERVARLVQGIPGADLIVLPEIWNVGYFNFDRYEEEAEPLEGPTLTRLRAVASSLDAWVMAGSIVEREGGRLRNTSVLLDRSGDVRATYSKIHLFGYRSREPEVLTPGKTVNVVDTEFGRIGLSTCYDLRFPELFRKMVDAGAEFFLVPSAWPYPRVEAWKALNRVRALENQAWLISSNCAGGTGMGFCGRSMVVDPWGTPVALAGDRPTILHAEIDPAEVRKAREDFPVLRDRVAELQSP
jgi:predicted amidohydrolase